MLIPKDGAIPGPPEPLPDDMTYDAARGRLHMGKGFDDKLPPEVRANEVSGMNVLRQWFSYRKRDRAPLSATAASLAAAYGWPGDLTDEQNLERLFRLNQERAVAQ
jgi:hypothetical protein